MASIELFQFPNSHYNEKARWALDLKRVPHERISLLPGPHRRTVKKLTGATETPVLRDDGRIVAGSTSILEHLERRFPDPALFPEDAGERERVLGLVSRFDEEVGPAVRLAKFFEVMDADYAVGTFCQERGAPTRRLYRASFPLLRRIMIRSMGIDAERAATARDITRQALDLVAKKFTIGLYLVGDRFTAADLTCASLLMPCVSVADWGGPRDAETEKSRRWLARWAEHPGAAWVREIYQRHRKA